MNQGNPTPARGSELRGLTTAVWVLAFLIVINLLLSLFGIFMGPTVFRYGPGDDSSASISVDDEYSGFHDWPLSEQVSKASVVALTVHKKDGDKIKVQLSEILKKNPGTVFYYHIDDEYPPRTIHPKENTHYGDGQVLFFTGSPATIRVSYSYEDGRIRSLGDMPMNLFRDEIDKQMAVESKD